MKLIRGLKHQNDAINSIVNVFNEVDFIMENISFPFKTTCYAGEKSKERKRSVKT